MKVYGRITVFPDMPPRINRLYELAYNLWWSWHPEARALYSTLDPELWETVGHNPVRFLSEVSPVILEKAASNPEYLRQFDTVLNDFDRYMHPGPEGTWFSRTYPSLTDKTIAYFSAEFGLHEALPIYSGGLGILSGDHCKEASDLGLPFVGVGFLYPQGYFSQQITREGRQEAIYEKLHFSQAPVVPAVGPDGHEVMISVDLPGRRIYAKVWRLMVGRIPLYLMDTDVEPNAPADRELSARLYAGDREMRISQEIMLGIGGVRALRALGIEPAVWHLNEGHAAFLSLERCRELVAQGMTFDEAREVVTANSLFTTHTPVPAGNDTFNYDLIDKYFGAYWGQLGLTRDQFLEVAREDHGWGATYGMTVLALRLTGQHNGVSALHGAVSRKMWQFLWPGLDVDDVPIGSITNGVHTFSWIAPEINALFQRYLAPDWGEHIDDAAFWDNRIQNIPDDALWHTHLQRKKQLIEYARRSLREQHLRLGEGSFQIAEFEQMLKPEALIIGFARRFATYKRATLLFRDIERLKRILNDPERPVQIIFAGKAHPADEPGKALIEQIYHHSRSPEFKGKIILLENYDIDMARYLVSGADLWLNNPIRPYEASGTSGQKAALNGLPNFSILDGWWAEGYNGSNGWSIGEEREYHDQEVQADADSASLYDTLENEIIPTFFNYDERGIPTRWIAYMKEAIRTCTPQFSMRRMVKEYTTRYYVPEIEQGTAIQQNNYERVRTLARWKKRVQQHWPSLQLYVNGQREGQLSLGESIEVHAWVRVNELTPEELLVELVYGDLYEEHARPQYAVPMRYVQREQDGAYRFDAVLQPEASGSIAYNVRVVPSHPLLTEKYEMGLIRWG
ncbi:starch phosphorylase [Thermosporothrix hazakensis]|jgi:starch phosphorylase|uniref:Starch phosphorylase n=1 Tax=Thermosporothrix hazakensis TaxID=644383 RepID=A0A326UC43_THEHA|nr:alpha-glucan family phosphorylase [Thermosporothrix hazakensis]PZW36192.1 starch phosphorylase [Thermosporothrix hazakensis]GCE46843.1 alpha-1,4 glucan phosphorylase [Thermosporothrix hazakensis]